MKKTARIATLATVTALGAGAAVSMASPAQAAGSVWDRVAQCESTGNWSINTGNGFYGGLQFTHSTWIAFGGGAYADNANGASRAEQIAVAQRVLASQGPGAWPVCSIQAGLTTGNGGSTGYTPVVTTHRTTTTPVTHKVTSSRTAPAHKVTTRKVPTTPRRTAPVTGQAPVARGTVRVQAGDTLSKIAAKHGTTWQRLWTLNKSTISNPNLIFVGQLIKF